ncbi:MAG: type I-U CRISPR-associated helicase/endonuclease Cas3 [Gemmatimonadales bacterium]
MTSLPPFPFFFRALWGYDPFPWQSLLAERVVNGIWPTALDLPTASGKTACLEIALFALAAQADRPTAERTAPRRIWFVVDRRIVVDEAYERAGRIAARLESAADGPLALVASRLREVAGTDRPLAVARLRGGVLRDKGWFRLPSQPAIITSTVDQLGSRLLFRGYGHSDLTSPIFAGLAANDSLIILDEAHCAIPFLQTLRSIQGYRGPQWAEAPVPTPFGFVVLSATPPEGMAGDSFPGAIREEALAHPILQQRLHAAKPASLLEVKAKGPGDADPLAARAVEQALAYIKEGKRRVAVMLNRVRTAQEIADGLRKRGTEEDIVLLTGRLRSFDRDRLVEQWSRFLRADSPDTAERPILLVTTQCLEVGADFSFDALVTECASLDALRQRFGRLNRMGEHATAPATIVARDRDTDPKKADPDPIYGRAIAHTWQLLKENASGDVIDFGFEALRATVEGMENLDACLAPAPDAPVLLPAHLDLLCQTAPAPAPEPDIQLFLHGKNRGASEAQVVWRADLAADGTGTWLETVALCPPTSGEMLSVPLYRLRAFLAQTSMGDDPGDLEGVPDGEDDAPRRGRPFLIWRGRERSKVSRNPSGIPPGAVVILPSGYGLGMLGQPAVEGGLGNGVPDLWERTLEPAGKPPAVRLTREVLNPWGECPPVSELLDLVEDPEPDLEAIGEVIDRIDRYEPKAERDTPPPEWWRDLVRRARTGRRLEQHPAGGIIWRGRRAASTEASEPDLFADDDDLTSAAGMEVGLDEHSDLVGRTVVRIAEHCLPVEYREVLRLAAYWHDVGKLDERFQILLRGGDEIAALMATFPLAKSASIPTSPAERSRIRAASGLPAHFRHEMLSMQLAEASSGMPDDGAQADLFLHLVASHHGHARPFAPVCLDPAAPGVEGRRGDRSVTLTSAQRAELPPAHRLDSRIAERYWRLVRRYGWWGLAYLEAILRLGDWYASGFVESGPPQVREESAV